MLVLAPATCCLGGIAADQILTTFCKSIRPEEGSGGWASIIKTWLDGPEAQTQEDATVHVDAKPAVSATSSAGAGKRTKGSSRVCPAVIAVQVDNACGCRFPATQCQRSCSIDYCNNALSGGVMLKE